MIRIALAIPTTASWAPGRAESLARLKQDLGITGVEKSCTIVNSRAIGSDRRVEYLEFDNRMPRDQWSAVIWGFGVEMGYEPGATHFLQLQDDMRVAPDGLFWHALHAMIEAHPEQILNLQSVHQAAQALAAEGVCGYTTIEGMPGPAYCLPIPLLREFLEWRRTSLKDGALQAITEDTLLGIFAMVTHHRIWAPVPTIVDHPGEVESTYGNDKAERQRPLVRWDLMGEASEKLTYPDYWRGDTRHLGRLYAFSIPALARKFVKGYSEEDERRDKADTGAHEMRRLYHARRAKSPPPAARLFVCTPYRGGLAPQYVKSILGLMSAIEGIEVVNEITACEDPAFVTHQVEDLVRVRSRLVQLAKESDCTHMLFADSDVDFGIQTVFGMLQSGFDFVQAPYPRRDGRGYSIRWLPTTLKKGGLKDEDIERETVEILATGLGCTLLSRRCIEKMIDHYSNEPDPEAEFEAILRSGQPRRQIIKAAYELGRSHGHRLVFDDFPKWDPLQKGKKTVAVFQLMIGPDEPTGCTLLSGEDASFCERWRRIGEQVRMYVGKGSPIGHMGEHLYEGSIEQFGLMHKALP